MDLSYSPRVGNGAWRLTECTAWTKANGVDAIRPNATGILNQCHFTIRHGSSQGNSQRQRHLSRHSLTGNHATT